jgi:prephenate dehydrogenase
VGDPPFGRVGIVGLGLIGGSIALGIRRAWPAAVVIGVDQAAVVDVARDRGVITERGETLSDLRDVDLMILATPVPEIAQLLRRAADEKVRTLVTDVGSTKRRIMAAAKHGAITFVGGHPIAGSARGGLDHARPDLFEGHPWLLVPGDAAEPVVGRLERLVRGLGAIPRRTDAETHDRVMAYVSHLPQLLSSALMTAAGAAIGEPGLALSGRGFADMTRLASSPAEIWRGILATNTDYIAEAVGALIAALPSTTQELADNTRVEDVFRHANEWFATMDHSKTTGGR